MGEPVGGVLLPDDVLGVLFADSRIQRVELTGSRASGVPTVLSDWDFKVTTAEFETVRARIRRLVSPLRPVVTQWDRLSRAWCYMMILAGPAKIDLIFDQPHPIQPPWRATAKSLPRIDDHFWDWVLWLGSKQLAGRHDVVTAELPKLHAHLLGPLGVAAVPANIGEAVSCYRAARDDFEKRLQCQIPRTTEAIVMPSLREMTDEPGSTHPSSSRTCCIPR
jgi:hypothetical protein